MGFVEGLGILLAFGSILFLAVVFTKLVASKTKRSMGGKYISVVETLSIGMDKQIHLVKAGESFVLIASAGKTVTYLTTLELDTYDEENATGSTNNMFDFKSLFDKYIQAYKDKKTGKRVDKVGAVSSKEADDITNTVEGDVFKKNLQKLKTITRITRKQGKLDGDDFTNDE